MDPRAQNRTAKCTLVLVTAGLAIALVWSVARAQNRPVHSTDPFPLPSDLQNVDLLHQTAEQAASKSAGCVDCHQNTQDPHFKDTLHLGCCDCHGGNPETGVKEQAHVAPRFPEAWTSSGNPVRSYTLLN